MSAPFLLDANALIALTVTDHEHHERAAQWAGTDQHFALCPTSEGALARFIVRIGSGPETVQALLSRLYASPRCEFWADSLSYVDTELSHVHSHRQVTDAYLAALAAVRGARLATFDEALTATLPEQTFLIP
ncbi:MAG TPA: PIN domain-containing protein [Jiangellaceae bacterium]|nr:PIN domain-containing protein [Jiangellaceae bacterium]